MMLDHLTQILTIQTAADSLPRNQGEYRILEIDFERRADSSSRPRHWDYAFWAPWVSCVEPVRKCETREEVLEFFDNFRITQIDDGMNRKVFPELDLCSEKETYHTIADTITVDVDGGRCFIIRDWDRSKRAYRLFLVYSNRELGDWTREGSDDADQVSWRMKEFLIP